MYVFLYETKKALTIFLIYLIKLWNLISYSPSLEKRFHIWCVQRDRYIVYLVSQSAVRTLFERRVVSRFLFIKTYPQKKDKQRYFLPFVFASGLEAWRLVLATRPGTRDGSIQTSQARDYHNQHKKKFKIIIKIFLYYTICILHNIEICFVFFFCCDIFVVFLWYIGILGGQSGSITGCMYQLIFSRIGLKVMHGNYRVFCKPTGSSVNLSDSSLKPNGVFFKPIGVFCKPTGVFL